jgi:hypothetical protein
MKWTKDKVKEAVQAIFSRLEAGENELDIVTSMGISEDEYWVLRRKMLEQKSDELRKKPQEHVYVEYLINQSHNIRDLTDMIEEFRNTKQYNAMVGAIRARAEIHNMLVAKGQEFGLIKKTPDRKEIIAGVMVTNLSNEELKKEIVGQLKNLNELMRKHGDQNIIDMQRTDSIYHGPALPPHPQPIKEPMPESSKTKVAVSKVNRGRKIAMPPAPIEVRQDD